MEPELLRRLLWAIAILAGGVGLYWLVNYWLITRAQRRNVSIKLVTPGTPAILYFTTPDCIPCKTFQRPVLQMLQAQLGRSLQVVEINATVQQELAKEWNVLSVPTTWIIDPEGQPRFVNHGVADANKILRQLQEINTLI